MGDMADECTAQGFENRPRIFDDEFCPIHDFPLVNNDDLGILVCEICEQED